MEIFLKIYDDADDWLSVAWLASGPVLWMLIVLLLAVTIVALPFWFTGPVWPAASAAAVIVGGGLIPVIKRFFA